MEINKLASIESGPGLYTVLGRCLSAWLSNLSITICPWHNASWVSLVSNALLGLAEPLPHSPPCPRASTFQEGQQHHHHVLLEVQQLLQQLDLAGVLQGTVAAVRAGLQSAVLLPQPRAPSPIQQAYIPFSLPLTSEGTRVQACSSEAEEGQRDKIVGVGSAPKGKCVRGRCRQVRKPRALASRQWGQSDRQTNTVDRDSDLRCLV